MNDELLIKFLLKETSEEEHITVQNWMDTSPSNKKYFLDFEKIWNSSKTLAPKSHISETDAWLRFKEKAAGNKQPATQKIRPAYHWLKIAAVLVLVAAGWAAYNIFAPVSYITVMAGSTVTTKMLPDGSELTLNKNARISYAKNFKNNRSIHLEQGNVFFDVAHDKRNPFVISIDQVSVLVVGTSFNIKYLNGETEVIVETGIVKVSLGKKTTSLQKGEKVVISKASDQLIKTENTDQLYNYYRSKEFITDNTPLWTLVEVLNEEYGSEIIIKDQAIKNLTFNTTLKTASGLEHNLQIICETNNLVQTRNQNQIILSKHQ